MVAKIIRGIWQCYAAVIIILVVFSFVFTYKAGLNIGLPLIISAFFTSIYLIGLYGYVYNEAILNRKFWRFCFWLNILSLCAKLLSYILNINNELLIDLISVVILSVPMIVALYRYSKRDNKLWPSSVFAEKTLLLEKLIADNSLLSATAVSQEHDGNIKTDVQIQKNTQIYEVTITKNKDGNEEKFNNEFTQLEALIEFIEENTAIKAIDFA